VASKTQAKADDGNLGPNPIRKKRDPECDKGNCARTGDDVLAEEARVAELENPVPPLIMLDDVDESDEVQPEPPPAKRVTYSDAVGVDSEGWTEVRSRKNKNAAAKGVDASKPKPAKVDGGGVLPKVPKDKAAQARKGVRGDVGRRGSH
jgi:hypothetical protein